MVPVACKNHMRISRLMPKEEILTREKAVTKSDHIEKVLVLSNTLCISRITWETKMLLLWDILLQDMISMKVAIWEVLDLSNLNIMRIDPYKHLKIVSILTTIRALNKTILLIWTDQQDSVKALMWSITKSHCDLQLKMSFPNFMNLLGLQVLVNCKWWLISKHRKK